MSVTVVRWKLGEERLKKDLEGACAAQPEGTSEGTPEGEHQGKEGIDPNVKREEVKKEKKTPDFLASMLERVIDTILHTVARARSSLSRCFQLSTNRHNEVLCYSRKYA